jgi:hypothetical protein
MRYLERKSRNIEAVLWVTPRERQARMGLSGVIDPGKVERLQRYSEIHPDQSLSRFNCELFSRGCFEIGGSPACTYVLHDALEMAQRIDHSNQLLCIPIHIPFTANA